MMTKYQLVFVKLETTLYKILATLAARKRLRLRKAFYQFRTNALTHRAQEQRNTNKKMLVYLKFKNTLAKFTKVLVRQQQRCGLQLAMARLRLNTEARREESKVRQKNNKKMNEVQQELVAAIKKLDSLTNR
jgi:hypothetical protein